MLAAREIGFNHQKGKKNIDITSKRQLEKNQCAFCIGEGHWKVDCPNLKNKKESKLEANFLMADDNDFDSSVFTLSITLTVVCYLEKSEWILDTSAIYHACPEREWLASFEN